MHLDVVFSNNVLACFLWVKIYNLASDVVRDNKETL